jgi:hypothetical protein
MAATRRRAKCGYRDRVSVAPRVVAGSIDANPRPACASLKGIKISSVDDVVAVAVQAAAARLNVSAGPVPAPLPESKVRPVDVAISIRVRERVGAGQARQAVRAVCIGTVRKHVAVIVDTVVAHLGGRRAASRVAPAVAVLAVDRLVAVVVHPVCAQFDPPPVIFVNPVVTVQVKAGT